MYFSGQLLKKTFSSFSYHALMEGISWNGDGNLPYPPAASVQVLKWKAQSLAMNGSSYTLSLLGRAVQLSSWCHPLSIEVEKDMLHVHLSGCSISDAVFWKAWCMMGSVLVWMLSDKH